MPRIRLHSWGGIALVLGAVVAGGCAARAASPPPAAAPADAPSVGGSARPTFTVRPVDLEKLEQPNSFPCPDVDEDDPDYTPCDGGRR